MPLKKKIIFCIHYFSKMKCKSIKTITERCFSCQNKQVCQKCHMPTFGEKIQLYRRRFATNRVESSAISHPLLLAAKSRLLVIRRFNFAGDDLRRIVRIESSRQQFQRPCYCLPSTVARIESNRQQFHTPCYWLPRVDFR